jgi:uncharacterized membrane protein YkvA (DUF1232 family)
VGGDTVSSKRISELCLPGANPNTAQPEAVLVISWRQQAQRLQRKAQVVYFACKHTRAPWYARLIAACTAGYLFSPIQLIPNFIPVIGFLDDLLVFFLGVKLLQTLIPPAVLAECRELAKASEMRRKDEVRSTAAIVAFVVIATLWLLAAASAGAVMVTYIPR